MDADGEHGTGVASYRVVYTEAMVRDAVRAFVWRRMVVELKALWLVEGVMLALFAWLLWQGDRSWVVGLVGAVLCLAPLMVALVWAAHFRNTVGRFRRMPEPAATVTVRPDGLAVASGLGSGQLLWPSLTDVWQRPGAWMVFSGTAQFFTLPVDGIAAADLDRLRAEVERNRATLGARKFQLGARVR